MSNRVVFDVGGQIYSISLAAIQNGPSSKLKQLYTSGRTVSGPSRIEIDRPVDLFASVLALYQTGELHFSMTSCPGAFLNELEFWDISPEVVESCCYERLQSFVDEQGIFKKFRKSREECKKQSRHPSHLANSFQGKIWNIIDYSKPSVLGKIYFVISLCMVLLSVFTLAFSTDPYFRRKITNCERLEYMKSSGMKHVGLAEKWLKRDCENEAFPDHSTSFDFKRPLVDSENACKPSAYIPYESYEMVYLNEYEHKNETDQSTNAIIGGFDTTPSRETNTETNFSFTSSLQNQTESSTAADEILSKKIKGEFVLLPVFQIQIGAFMILDTVTVVYFTLDMLLRIIFCPSRKFHFLSIINFTDVLALIGTYMHIILMEVFKHEKYRDSWMDVLKYLQVLRSLRLLRTVSNVRAGQVLAYTVQENLKDLLIIVLLLVVGVSSFASCLFVAEEREDIQSIPVGWYWALVTMTTVGYGDITPKSAVGRVIASLCAFTGIVLLALTVPIFANNFLTLYKYSNSEKAIFKFKQTRSKFIKEGHENTASLAQGINAN